MSAQKRRPKASTWETHYIRDGAGTLLGIYTWRIVPVRPRASRKKRGAKKA